MNIYIIIAIVVIGIAVLSLTVEFVQDVIYLFFCGIGALILLPFYLIFKLICLLFTKSRKNELEQ
jgi:hypothetical protein